jgi:hypothetical protein
MPIPSPPRYTVRLLPLELQQGAHKYAVWDSFLQSWFSVATTKAAAESIANSANRRYERTDPAVDTTAPTRSTNRSRRLEVMLPRSSPPRRV